MCEAIQRLILPSEGWGICSSIAHFDQLHVSFRSPSLLLASCCKNPGVGWAKFAFLAATIVGIQERPVNDGAVLPVHREFWVPQTWVKSKHESQ